MISSQHLPKIQYRISLADSKKLQYTRLEKKFRSSYRSHLENPAIIIKFHPEQPSVMHTKHYCTKSRGKSLEKMRQYGSCYVC